MWVFFLCCHLIGLVGYNLLLRKSLLAQVDKWLLGTLMQTGIALPLLCVILFYHPVIPHINTEHIGLLIAATLLVILLQWSNVNALARLEVGVYSVLYNLRIVLTTILGVVF